MARQEILFLKFGPPAEKIGHPCSRGGLISIVEAEGKLYRLVEAREYGRRSSKLFDREHFHGS